MLAQLRQWFEPSAWVLHPTPSTLASNAGWSNGDMDPVPPEKRTWTTFNYVAYWVSDAWNAAVWQLASSMIAIGLSWRQALPAIAVGHVIISVVMVLNGTPGARLHVGFPVLNRSSFGFWFSYFTVVSRIVLSMFWLGIQSYTGSQCVHQMLKAIWPSFANFRNDISSGAHITSSGILCYFLYTCILFPLMFVSPQRIRWLFLLKALIVPPAWIAMLVWAFVKVPPTTGLFQQKSTLSGSALSYAWLSALNSALGIYSTLAVNIPDFTRYAKNERVQYIQLLVIPVAFTVVGFIGIAVTSAGSVLYNEVLWNPLNLIGRWDNRAASFFASATFALATLGTNVSANTLSAANDITALFPRYINIRRGQVVCMIIGCWAFVPWEIVTSAQGFLSFMNGYTILLGPFAGIMVADFWLVHRGHVDVAAMYRPSGRYRYTYGVNLRAAATLLITVPPNVPGLIAAINGSVRIGQAFKIFDFAWLFGFFVSISVYTALSLVFPAKETFLMASADGEKSFDGSQETLTQGDRVSEICRSDVENSEICS